eukprot:scaffold116468_cov38-Prasinocladus_malaysianus.AAC.1
MSRNFESSNAKSNLEVVWQLGASRVAGVHGDKDAAGGDEADLLAEEVETLLAVLDGLHHNSNLGRHHRQHLHLDAVELVQAGPGARLSQPAEHLAGHLVVDAVRAVEDNHIARQGLPKVLHRLRLAGPCWPQGVAASPGEHCRAQGHVAAVCQRGDHQASVVAL